MSANDDQKKPIMAGAGILSLIQLIIGIVAVVFGDKNLDDMCSDSFLHLGIWMIVQGSVFLVACASLCPLVCFLGELGLGIYIAFISLYGLFELIWSIIGGVILWRDSLPCNDLNPSFYAAASAVVIISLILVCCVSIKVRVTINGGSNA